MYKYSSINSYSLRNLHKNQIYFNSPLNFNDPFDTFHDTKIDNLSNEEFSELYCQSTKIGFDKLIINRILENLITKDEFYIFCTEYIEHLFEFDEKKSNKIFRNKQNFLQHLKNIDEESTLSFINSVKKIFLEIKLNYQETIKSTFIKSRDEQLKKIGVSCFSKNNLNLLMWSHYADSHKGFCLEFNSNHEPFTKKFDVIYQENIPKITTDLLFNRVDNLETINKLLSYKSIDWKHEEEIRILHINSNQNYTYDSKSLKAIYFGLRSDKSDIEIICSLVKSQNPGVKFYQMEKVNNKFEIKPKEFNYYTPVEVQSILLTEISTKYKNKDFNTEQLLTSLVLKINESLLNNNLEDMVLKKILKKVKTKYRLII